MIRDSDNHVLTLALQLLNETGASFYLTGRAGTGKSTFIKLAQANSHKQIMVLAPTGIAALNIGGSTIHSFFEFPNRAMLPNDGGIKTFWEGAEKRKMIRALNTLIIDEVSMVRADVIDAIDTSLRKNGGNPNLPFGGIQMIFVGDIFQLEPIVSKKASDDKIIKAYYSGPRFYQASIFKELHLLHVELKKIYRQKDEAFISLLDKVREKNISHNDIQSLNERVGVSTPQQQSGIMITLTTRRDAASKINNEMLAKLNTQDVKYEAELEGEFDDYAYPNKRELKLKVGAQVIFVKNDPEKRWFNGTLGRIIELGETSITVETSDGSLQQVEPQNWKNTKYQFDKSNKSVIKKTIGSFKQYPLKLAWAITIHKSQGMTFEQANIDFGSGTFSSGQAYVALSRVTSLQGLYLSRPMNHSDIIVDPSAIEFTNSGRQHVVNSEMLQEMKSEFEFLQQRSGNGMAEYYLSKSVIFAESQDISNCLENLDSALRHIVDPDILFRERTIPLWRYLNSNFNVLNQRVSTLKSSLFQSLALMGSGQFSLALEKLQHSASSQKLGLGFFFLSLCQQKLKIFDQSLISIDQSLSEIKNARNYLQKARLTNPYLFKEKHTFTNRTIFIECLIQAFLLAPKEISIYEWLIQFNNDGEPIYDLPSMDEFKRHTQNEETTLFFDELHESVRKKRRKLIRKSTGVNIRYAPSQGEIPTSDKDLESSSDDSEIVISTNYESHDESQVTFDDYGFIDYSEEEG